MVYPIRTSFRITAQGIGKRAQHPHSGIARAATSQSDDKAPAYVFQGMSHQLAHPIGRGRQRVPPVRRYKGESACLSGFDDGRSVGCQSVTGTYQTHQRVVHGKLHHPSVKGGYEGMEHPLSPVGHGERMHPGPRRTENRCESIFHLFRSEAPLERVDGQHYIHSGRMNGSSKASRSAFDMAPLWR